MDFIHSHKELKVYQQAYQGAKEIHAITLNYPKEEKYSLSDQVIRSSRSVCANIAEAFRKRRYPKAFVSKLSDAEAEAAETQFWIDFSLDCDYLNKEQHYNLYDKYEHILSQLVIMINASDKWTIKKS